MGWDLIPWQRGHGYHRLDAHIYQFLPLPAAHTSTTITVEQRDARLITEDTVQRVPKFPPSVRSPWHSAVSPLILNLSRVHVGTPNPIASLQKPIYNAPNWQHPPRSADDLYAQTRSQDKTIAPDSSDQLSVFSGCGQTPTTPMPSLMWLTNVSRLRHKLLLVHSWEIL